MSRRPVFCPKKSTWWEPCKIGDLNSCAKIDGNFLLWVQKNSVKCLFCQFLDKNLTFNLVCFVAFYWTAKKIFKLCSLLEACVWPQLRPLAWPQLTSIKNWRKARKKHSSLTQKREVAFPPWRRCTPFFLFSYFLIGYSSIQNNVHYHKITIYVCVSVRTYLSEANPQLGQSWQNFARLR